MKNTHQTKYTRRLRKHALRRLRAIGHEPKPPTCEGCGMPVTKHGDLCAICLESFYAIGEQFPGGTNYMPKGALIPVAVTGQTSFKPHITR